MKKQTEKANKAFKEAVEDLKRIVEANTKDPKHDGGYAEALGVDSEKTSKMADAFAKAYLASRKTDALFIIANESESLAEFCYNFHFFLEGRKKVDAQISKILK